MSTPDQRQETIDTPPSARISLACRLARAVGSRMTSKITALLLGVTLGVTLAVAPALGDPADLDPTFGTGGKVLTPIGSSDDQATAVTLQADGRIVVAGHSFTSATSVAVRTL